MKRLNLKAFDLIFLILLVPLATVISIAINANYFESNLLFLGIPCLYLSLRVTPPLILKSFVFSSIFSIPLGIFVDYIVTADNGWAVPVSIFPKIFSIVPLEDLIFAFLFTYLAIVFYEYFVDKGRNHVIESRLHYLTWISIYVTALFLFAYYFFDGVLILPYAYLIAGIIFLLCPLIYIFLKYPKLLRKYVPIFLYFLLISVFFEYTALFLGQWEYTGSHYLTVMEWFSFSIPIEEIIFFWLLWGPAILAYYEFFDDDRR